MKPTSRSMSQKTKLVSSQAIEGVKRPLRGSGHEPDGVVTKVGDIARAQCGAQLTTVIVYLTCAVNVMGGSRSVEYGRPSFKHEALVEETWHQRTM